jgi:L-asparaginase II
MASASPLVRVFRSGLEESVHRGHVAVCDVEGRVAAFVGDPSRLVYARSCMKPLQAAVSLQAIGDLDDDLIAVMCGSHNGEPVHVGTVRRLLRAAGLGVSALRNPPGWPLDPRSMARAGRPRRVLHNCSGKHAGMVVACQRSAWDLETYPQRDHPLQRRVHRAVLRGTDLAEVQLGVDGCGVPVHGMPLASMATLFARLVRPEAFGNLAGSVERCAGAMRVHPYLVGGRNRTDTAIMETTGGEHPDGLVVKSGAEGLACAAIADAGLGVAVKIEDGGERASGPALIHALSLLGALSASHLDDLDRFAHRPVKGGDGTVGQVAPRFRLRKGAGNR